MEIILSEYKKRFEIITNPKSENHIHYMAYHLNGNSWNLRSRKNKGEAEFVVGIRSSLKEVMDHAYDCSLQDIKRISEMAKTTGIVSFSENLREGRESKLKDIVPGLIDPAEFAKSPSKPSSGPVLI